jgi:hypothetical protein
MKNKYFYLLYIPLLVLVGLESYLWWSLRPQNLIVGIWQGSTETITVYPGDTFSIKSIKNSEDPANGSYRFLDDKTLRIDLGGLSSLVGPVVINYQLSIDTITISDGKDSKTYERISNISTLLGMYQNGDLVSVLIDFTVVILVVYFGVKIIGINKLNKPKS